MRFLVKVLVIGVIVTAFTFSSPSTRTLLATMAVITLVPVVVFVLINIRENMKYSGKKRAQNRATSR